MCKLRFSAATNFDNELPARLASHSVVELFGKLPRDAAGGGRASYMLAPVSRHRLEEHVREARRHGMAFDYLINPACMGNREFTAVGQRDLRRLLDWISQIGVEWVTISIPMLLEIVKARYPDLKIRVGVYAQVNSPVRARYWEDLGADCITVEPLTANRDFRRLRAIRDSVKCDLQLLANAACLKECPLSPYHMVSLSHASQTHSERFMIDYCLLACSAMKLADPANYLMSPWIRPEDLRLYEAIGYKSFKILERDAPTDTLVNRVRAYHERRFDGNLIELIQPYGYKEKRSGSQPRRGRLWDVRTFLRPWKANPARLLRWREFAKMHGMLYESDQRSPLVIDNRALDGFVEGLIDRDCGGRDCDLCGYCRNIAQEVVRLDPAYRDRCIDLAQGLLDDMRSGAMWKYR
ncbi:MAG: U32 family peptidase [Armatimonadota bacterium]|nr:U32 family peptidase [Armatimonadota bacterium]